MRLEPLIFLVAGELEAKRKLAYEEVAQLCPEVVEEGRQFIARYERETAQLSFF